MSKLTAIRSGRSARTEFERFMLPHFELLYSRAYRLTGNSADAEDLVQDLCVRVYPRLKELSKVGNPKAWLLRVLYRLFVDLSRRQARFHATSIDCQDESDSSVIMACLEPGPEEYTESVLTQRRLIQALRTLRPEEQALLVLHEVEGYSLPELEEITELPQGTLKSRLHRARIRLGRLLQRDDNLASFDTGEIGHELRANRRSVG